MTYSGYEILWLFFIYSFAGWIAETVSAAFQQKRFVNRGLINAPFCVIYGFTAAAVTIFCGELHGFWLFFGGMILSTVIEWAAGHWIEKFYHERWWDYSKVKGNLDGYICLPMSLLWGVLCVVVTRWGNPFLAGVFGRIPGILGKGIVWALTGILIADIAASLCILAGRSKRIEQWEGVDSWLTGISSKIGRRIYGLVDRRLQKAYPAAREKAAAEAARAKANVFAWGCSFYKILWLFVIGAFLGDLVETVFCRVTAGVWMSRSSVVWGPISLVWGIAIAAGTLLLHK